jgi:hypothetical protein
MSTDLRPPNNPNPTGSKNPPDPTEEKKKVFDLSMTQVAGGALAAMTAAALGSTLGVAGTIVGAALASVVAGVAGSLYTASLRTGREKVRTVFRGQSTDAGSAPPAPVDPATTFSATRTSASATNGRALEETQALPAWDPLPLEKSSRTKRARAPFPWKRAVAVSLSVFALAAVLITGYERVSGQPLSGGTGTTVSQVGSDTSSGSDDGNTTTTQSATPSPSSTPSASESTPTASTSPAIGTESSASESGKSPSPSASESTPESAAPSVGTDGAAEAAPSQ